MAVSKRLRFEVLRRDNHTCRYCGRGAPDVKLAVDHVIPESLGGSDEPTNLVASCDECNAGKSSSTPDAALVAAVEDSAIRWSRALRQAAEIQRSQTDDEREFIESVLWPARDFFTVVPNDYQASILKFRELGLEQIDMLEALESTMRRTLFGMRRWKYFCGVCWNKIRERQEIALQILDAEDKWCLDQGDAEGSE